MIQQQYYANFPTKLHQQNFKSKTDRNLHLLAMSIIISWVHTQKGTVYLTVRKLAQEIECSAKKAREIIDNFQKWGYLKKVSEAKNQHQKTIYQLSTYNWNLETAKETALEPELNKKYQTSEQNSETATETANFHQTNNELTNNDITNNERDIYSPPYNPPSHKLESNDEDFDISDLFEDETKTEDFENIQIDNLDTDPVTPQKIVDLWNSILSGRIRRPISINELTRKELKALKKQCQRYPTLESWIAYFEKLRESEILWKVPSGWKPNLPWALNDEKRIKVMRGDYIPDIPEQVGKTKAELIRQQNIKAAMIYAERANQGVSFWDSLVCDE